MSSLNTLTLSTLRHTWIFDLDGTILKHNGYLTSEGDSLLDGAREFIEKIPATDMIIFLTARESFNREETIGFLKRHGIRFDKIIFDAPTGERILVNDTKPSGLETSIAVNFERDKFDLDFTIDPQK